MIVFVFLLFFIDVVSHHLFDDNTRLFSTIVSQYARQYHSLSYIASFIQQKVYWLMQDKNYVVFNNPLFTNNLRQEIGSVKPTLIGLYKYW